MQHLAPVADELLQVDKRSVGWAGRAMVASGCSGVCACVCVCVRACAYVATGGGGGGAATSGWGRAEGEGCRGEGKEAGGDGGRGMCNRHRHVRALRSTAMLRQRSTNMQVALPSRLQVQVCAGARQSNNMQRCASAQACSRARLALELVGQRIQDPGVEHPEDAADDHEGHRVPQHLQCTAAPPE